jgi:hypothetical protein
MRLKWDVFISHASEDKSEYVNPLVEELEKEGLKVWIDTTELTVGDSLRKKIDEGLRYSRFGIVILSENYFSKQWPLNELEGLLSLQTQQGKKRILPIWCGVERKYLVNKSPVLAGLVATQWSGGITAVVRDLVNAICSNRKSTVYISNTKNLKTLGYGNYTNMPVHKRLQLALRLINQNRHSDLLTIEKIAYQLRHEDCSFLNDCFSGKKEAPFKMRENISEEYGLNISWMNFGEKSPFYPELEISESNPCLQADKFLKMNPESIYYLQTKEDERESLILLKMSENKQLILKNSFRVSSHVGGGGTIDMVYFYKLMKRIFKEYYLKHKGFVAGRKIENTTYEKLINGELFPGVVSGPGYRNSHWWDDWMDIYHKSNIANGYGDEHGEEFLKAQEILRGRLELEFEEKADSMQFMQWLTAR